MEKSACRDADPSLFFPERGKHVKVNDALAYCIQCPVIADCRDYRERTKSDFGVWAGKLYTRKD